MRKEEKAQQRAAGRMYEASEKRGRAREVKEAREGSVAYNEEAIKGHTRGKMYDYLRGGGKTRVELENAADRSATMERIAGERKRVPKEKPLRRGERLRRT